MAPKRSKKCPGCHLDVALHKSGVAGKDCTGILEDNGAVGQGMQGAMAELQQRKAELTQRLELKKLQREVDALEKELATDTTTTSPLPPAKDGSKTDETQDGERKHVDFGLADITLAQLREDAALQSLVSTKYGDLVGAGKKPEKGHHTQLQRLDHEVEAAKRSAFAAGTYANLRTQWKAFLLFCEYFRLTAIPTDARTLTRYAQFLSRSLKSPSTVQIYIHGARLLQRFHGCEPPPSDAFELRLVLSSFRRQSQHVPQRKLPITPAILLRLRDHLDLNRPLHATLWAAYTVAFFTLLRKSNLVPKTTSAFDPGKHLTRGAIRVTSDGLVVRITWSKTLQFKQRVLLLPVPAIPGHPLCPRHAYVNMCSLLPVGSDSPAFLVPGSAGRLVSLTHDSLVAHLKTLLAAAGLPSGDYSGHSFRRGGATFAWHCGADPQLIKLLGDWSSDAFQSYLDSSFEQRRSFATLLATRINQGFLEPDRAAV
ncbi:PREDICTED: uncharacterized protein LOC109481127 [Branchiostoma belcheri]|uniref:Uncharacterized protein LOC109481127 n=1 Tax=Branchiostoma belcheri TaxID=7741 RepID=A0A6P5A7B0_BRABE|nr:PREDICTED: uncharacterized protein LOC109481127 [Branchiostoma belcheri]